jgi:hypothetical protein
MEYSIPSLTGVIFGKNECTTAGFGPGIWPNFGSSTNRAIMDPNLALTILLLTILQLIDQSDIYAAYHF